MAAVDFESEGSAARSSGVLVRLDTRAGTARVVRRFPRPGWRVDAVEGGFATVGDVGGELAGVLE
ncbi:hypothetical protein Tdes44962_MAKER03172 [Teratosphaeria destructans]|uniref:Uncharacterized protein n=1 Tax=Teratosphaeria destructans TaxID=418781 RepID=A0A9W7W1T3_9PEZI|nr:hypothetical protein Tdes44962_MAKER03172 [Teratosphaeria destructans]